jgi:hypothetical protein
MPITLVFADDSRQASPSRDGMGPLVAIGGLCVPGDAVHDLELAIDNLCKEHGFPPRAEFKWSPPRSSWMWKNLRSDRRFEFFRRALGLARSARCTARVVAEDTSCARATKVG